MRIIPFSLYIWEHLFEIIYKSIVASFYSFLKKKTPTNLDPVESREHNPHPVLEAVKGRERAD